MDHSLPAQGGGIVAKFVVPASGDVDVVEFILGYGEPLAVRDIRADLNVFAAQVQVECLDDDDDAENGVLVYIPGITLGELRGEPEIERDREA
jgi:hypothetical protein